MSSIIIVSDWGDREFSEPTDARFPLSFHQLLKYNISAFHPLSLNQSAGFYSSSMKQKRESVKQALINHFKQNV